MASFELLPARLREGKLIPVKGASTLFMEWPELRDRLAPGRSKSAMLLLRTLRPGSFVGTRRAGPKTITFTLDSSGRSARLPRALQTDPGFGSSVVEIFLVQAVDWGSRIVEARKA